MQPRPRAVEQKPRYIIFLSGNNRVTIEYPAIESDASPIPCKALKVNAIPAKV